jgi:hypothetical protein
MIIPSATFLDAVARNADRASIDGIQAVKMAK